MLAPDSEEASFRPSTAGEVAVVDEISIYSIRTRFDERLLRRSFASSRQLQQPRAHIASYPLDNEFDFANLEGLEGLNSRQRKASEDRASSFPA